MTEVPDPVPEVRLDVPQGRGAKTLRFDDPAMIDAVIAALVKARLILDPSGGADASPDAGQRCGHVSEHDGTAYACVKAAGHGGLHVVREVTPEPEPRRSLLPCPGHHGDRYKCSRLKGHKGACRDLDGFEWGEECGSRPYPAGSEGDDGTACVLPAGHEGPHEDGTAPLPEDLIAASRQVADERQAADGPEPYHSEHGPQCGDDTGDWGYVCNAQRGHGGEAHLYYREDGMVMATWPREPVTATATHLRAVTP